MAYYVTGANRSEMVRKFAAAMADGRSVRNLANGRNRAEVTERIGHALNGTKPAPVAKRCECGAEKGKGDCRACRLIRFNIALSGAKNELAGLDSKVTDEQVAKREDWARIACTYAALYSGSNEFLIAVRDAWKANKSLSISQMRGVLNVIRYEARKANEDAKPRETERTESPAPSVKLNAIADGYYTVSFEDGSHVTLRINSLSAKQTRNGKPATYASYLHGPINTHDYTRFAFVTGNTYRAFRSYGANYAKQVAALEILMGATDTKKYGKAYAAASKRCYVCGKLLTEPESIAAGIGPICAGRQ